MALFVENQKPSDAINGNCPSSYRLFGDFWLEEPEKHLSQEALNGLRALEPYLRDLEIQFQQVQSDSTKRAFNASDEFAQFQETESLLWNPPRRQDELVPPSGDFNWPTAHHLHNPSFVTQNPHYGETADPANPCIGLVMANAFVKGKTLIYDHLARREVVDGLVEYPEHILRCHEAWLLKIRRNMLAKVEILYGRPIQGRMLSICDLERLPLWGRYSGIALYFEWMSGDPESPAKLARILVFALHPQNFLFPWGKKFANGQDHTISIAHHLAGLTYKTQFYQDLHWSFVNRFPRLYHYTQQQALARDAFKAVHAAKGSALSSIKMPLEKQIPTQTRHLEFEPCHEEDIT